MRSFFVLLLLGVTLLTLALVVRSGMLARKHPGAPMNATMREAMADDNAYQLSAHDLELINLRYPGAKETPDGLRTLVLTTGTGTDTPRRGQLVTVTYTGRLLDGEVKFDASADHGGPFNFVVGENRVIAGWDEALLTMHKGEKRTLIIPFWLAYGEKGIRGSIPPRATLVFDVELVDFK